MSCKWKIEENNGENFQANKKNGEVCFFMQEKQNRFYMKINIFQDK